MHGVAGGTMASAQTISVYHQIRLLIYIIFSIDDCVFICILIMDVCTVLIIFGFTSGYMLITGLLYATIAIIRMSKAFLKLHYYVELLLGE